MGGREEKGGGGRGDRDREDRTKPKKGERQVHTADRSQHEIF